MGTLRLMLALAVAVGHFRGPFLLIEAHYAVQVFYIFSGFLISSILAEKYEGRVWLFYTNRAARIRSPESRPAPGAPLRRSSSINSPPTTATE